MLLSRLLRCPSIAAAAAAKPRTIRVLKMHGLPRGWMHDEVVKFIDVVATNVGATGTKPPEGGVFPEDDTQRNEKDVMDTALSQSAFVRRVRIPFGRRTGVLYGDPVVEVTSDVVADALLSLTFDEYSDSRRRLRFTEEDADAHSAKELAASTRMQREETEDALALATLELDRFLLDPDLLYDMKKRRQGRRLTLKEKIRVDTFRESDEDETVGSQGDLSSLGRGSSQNLDIPLPYVQGRKGF
jgi:hypothetical protein